MLPVDRLSSSTTLLALLEQATFGEVRANKSRTTCNQVSQRSLLKVCRNRPGLRGRPNVRTGTSSWPISMDSWGP